VKLGRSHPKVPSRRIEDIILFAVGPMQFAIAAKTVDEIRNTDGLKPYAPGRLSPFAKVKYTLIRENKDRSITYFVVDAALHFHLTPGQGARVLVLRETGAAVLVDSIERMTQIGTIVPLPQAFTGKEREWYRGLAIVEQRVFPVVEPAAFLNKGEIAVLQAEARSASKAAVAGEVLA
jgi:chemotaxis signal transduction protein